MVWVYESPIRFHAAGFLSMSCIYRRPPVNSQTIMRAIYLLRSTKSDMTIQSVTSQHNDAKHNKLPLINHNS